MNGRPGGDAERRLARSVLADGPSRRDRLFACLIFVTLLATAGLCLAATYLVVIPAVSGLH